jgi:hypothetical protein
MDTMLALGLVAQAAYDLAAAAAVIAIARDLWTRRPQGWLYLAVALLATAVTWTFIIRFAQADQAQYDGYLDWVRRSVFFFTAWKAVTSAPERWWWTSQLLFAVPPVAVFFALESRRRCVPAVAAYVWLGFLGAISTALALFLFRTSASDERTDEQSTTPAALAVCIVLAVASALALPYLGGGAYRAALLFAHAIMIVPFHVRSRQVGVSPAALYGLTGVTALAAHVGDTARLLEQPGGAALSAGEVAIRLIQAIAVNAAQTSVTFDLLFVWLLAAAILRREAPRRWLALTALGLVASPGAALAFGLAWREWAADRAPRARRESPLPLGEG